MNCTMRNHLISTAVIFFLFVVWQIAASSGAISELYLPSPYAVWNALVAMYPEILLHAGATFIRVLIGFILGGLFGVFLGLLMSWNSILKALIDPLVEGVRPVPAIAVLPFFILWFGTGNLGQVFLIALSCGSLLAVDTYVAIRNVSSLYIQASRCLGAGRLTLFWTVVMPSILPKLIAGVRIAAATSFTITIAAEFMGAQIGLGYLIMRSRRTLETQTILLCIGIIATLARVMDSSIRRLMGQLTKWSPTSEKALKQ